MKLKVLTTAILLSAIPLIQLAVTRPSLSQSAATPATSTQPDLNTQLQQALCAQNWGRALEVLDQMKRRAGPAYASQLTLYRGRVEAIARENARVPEWTVGCSGGEATTENPSARPNILPNSQPMTPPGYPPNGYNLR